MIDPKDVTPGYWYVLSLSNVNVEGFYDIVKVDNNDNVWEFHFDHPHANKYGPYWVFISPVSDPIGKPEEAIKDLKSKLDLPTTASTREVFRAALKVAKSARDSNG